MPNFDGLNLTWETLEGLVKHNGPLTDRDGQPLGALSRARRAGGDPRLQPDPGSRAVVVCQRRGAGRGDRRRHRLRRPRHRRRPARRPVRARRHRRGCDRRRHLREIDARPPALDPPRRVHETVRPLITRMIEDVIAETDRRMPPLKPGSADEVRQAGGAAGRLFTVHAKSRRRHQGLPAAAHVPARRESSASWAKPRGVVRDLFAHYVAEPCRPAGGMDGRLRRAGESARARRIADYIAGMTDRYALIEHAKLFRLDAGIALRLARAAARAILDLHGASSRQGRLHHRRAEAASAAPPPSALPRRAPRSSSPRSTRKPARRPRNPRAPAAKIPAATAHLHPLRHPRARAGRGGLGRNHGALRRPAHPAQQCRRLDAAGRPGHRGAGGGVLARDHGSTSTARSCARSSASRT